MSQVTARLPEPLVKEMDLAAKRLRRTRTDLIRHAVEYYLDDLEDLKLGLERLEDPADPVLDWKDVRRELLGQD
jgi:RHH-type rel operon transcriptional repressor/antitoxin RelB